MVDINQRPPYKGSDPSLVIAIDVGTTYSGVSYAILEPGKVPEVHDVTSYKGQEHMRGSSKVPTVLLYDSSGTLKACGAETNEVAMEEEGDEELLKVQWFKLLLRPPSMDVKADDVPPVTLPNGMTVVDVWGDFLRYMKNCVRDYIVEREVNGANIWNAREESATYILTHPNGWRGHQQDEIRQAAVRGGLVPHEPDGWKRIEFLSEGEASFHWCVGVGLAKNALDVGTHVTICDAGGGTIDVSSFRVASVRPLQLQEAMESDSRIAGSVFVTSNFRFTVNDRLTNSKYGAPEYVSAMTKKFEETNKGLFKDDSKTQRVKFGGKADNDEEYDIKHGFLTLPGQLVAAFFENSVKEAVDAIQKHLPADGSESYVFLVGGFAASSWLFSEVRRRLADRTPNVSRDDSQTAKAVCHGAVVAHLDGLVSARVAKNTYGVQVTRLWEDKPEYWEREEDSYICPFTGCRFMRGGFECLVQKGSTISDEAQYRVPMSRTFGAQEDVSFEMKLERYTGSIPNIAFHSMDEYSTFEMVCSFKAEIPASALVHYTGKDGDYWSVSYDVVVWLGRAEMKCFIEWQEDDETKRCVADSTWEDF